MFFKASINEIHVLVSKIKVTKVTYGDLCIVRLYQIGTCVAEYNTFDKNVKYLQAQ